MSEPGHEAEADPLRLDRQVCFPLYAATNMIQRLYRPLLDPLGLTYTQYLVMLILWEQDQVSIGEIRECLHLDIGTLSPLLKRMERAGLVTRTRDAADERRVLIAPTAHGRSLREAALAIPEALANRTGLTPGEVGDMRDRAQALVAKLAAVAA